MTIIDASANMTMAELPKAPPYFRQIANLLPYHRTYVELYANGPMLLPIKKRSAVEVFNDPNDTVRNLMAAMRTNVISELTNALRSGKHPICRFHNVQIESKLIADVLEVYDTVGTLFLAAAEVFEDHALRLITSKLRGNVVLYGTTARTQELILLKWKHKEISSLSEPQRIVDVWTKR